MFADLSPADQAKYVAAKRAVELVEDGMKLGLGTGSTAAWMVRCLAERVKTEGLRIQGVPTSTRTADLARELGLEVVTLDQAGHLDITIDGTDEFDSALSLIKGDFDKHVPQLGKFPLPVEVLGFGLASSRDHIARLLADHGLAGRDITMRMQGDTPSMTDEGNFILDLHLEHIPDAPALAIALNQVPGVVENGLFINICDRVILGASDGRIEQHRRP